MAKSNYSAQLIRIDRRQLLTAASVVTAVGMLPSIEPPHADAVQGVDAIQPAPEVLNVCTATARRLLEIAGRNEIRREAKLPLLSIVQELRRMKHEEDLQEFGRFQAVHRKSVWDELLGPRRKAESNPNWQPSSLEGIYYQNEVCQTLWERFYALRREARVRNSLQN